MSIPFERHFPSSDAYTRIKEELSVLGLRPHIQYFGDELGSCWVDLYNHEHKKVATGSGKGQNNERMIGALFNALEQYLIQMPVDQKKLFLKESSSLSASDNLPMRLIQTQNNQAILCRRYYHSLNVENFDDYPVFLSCPNLDKKNLDDFDYHLVNQYSSNNGIAIGLSLDEARLHAFNEVIEREAISIFLTRHFYLQRHDSIQSITLNSINDLDLKHMWEYAENLLGTHIELIHLEHGLKPYVFIAIPKYASEIPPNMLALCGSGASLLAKHAAQRAISELVQKFYNRIHLPEESQKYLENIQRLKKYPRLLRCFCMDSHMIQRASIPFFNEDSNNEHLSIKQQIDLILKSFQENNISSYEAILSNRNQNIFVTHILVPSFEHFFMIQHGHIVLPSSLGKMKANRVTYMG
jgi:ribosomal protein S12 methylthiotransferase accessory factor